MTATPQNQYRPLSRAGLPHYANISRSLMLFERGWVFAVHEWSEDRTRQKQLVMVDVPGEQVQAFKDLLTHFGVLEGDVARDIRLKRGPRTREVDYVDMARDALKGGKYRWRARLRRKCVDKGIRAPTDWEYRKLAALFRKTKGR